MNGPLTRPLLAISLLLIAAGPLGSHGSLPSLAAPPGTASAKPNVILLMVDDLDYLLQTTDSMPNLKSLIRDKGVTFENFVTTISLCCPSRVTYLRGQYVHNHEIVSNAAPDGGFEKFKGSGAEQSSIAVWLKAAGYSTALIGKYLNGYPEDNAKTYIPPGWDEWISPSTEGNAYAGYNYTLNENGTLNAHGNAPTDYLTDVLTAKTLGVIQRLNQKGAPFFIYLAPYSPHAPANPAPRHANLFPLAKAPRPPSFNEADMSDKPRPIRLLPSLTAQEIDDIDALYRQRLRSMQAVDDMIGLIVNALSNAGQLENTYFLFSSDNGYHMGQHRARPTKYLPYEEDIRVPLFVRGPGVPAGLVRNHLVGTIDIAPTIAELAGATAPSFVDGRSFATLLTGAPIAESVWRQAFLVEQYPLESSLPIGGVSPADPGVDIATFYTAIRTTRYKYVEYGNSDRELYDLLTDPYELASQHATAPVSLIRPLARWLQELRACAAATCRAIENAAPSPYGTFLADASK